jgi:DNA-directed RNA polymerase specialized sigma24 family protein
MEAQHPDPHELTEKQWTHIHKRLLLFAYKKYGRHHMWNGGIDLNEVVQDAIEDTLLGIRRWPPVNAQGQIKDISLFCFLCNTVRSKVSHILEQQDKRVSLNYESKNDWQELQLTVHRLISPSIDSSDQQASYNELCRLIVNAVCDDRLLTRIARLLINTPDLQPKDIAKRLSISEMEARNAIKRLARRFKKMMEERSSMAQVSVIQYSSELESSKTTGGRH